MKVQLAYPLNTREPTEREAMRHLAIREIGAAFSSPLASGLLAYALRDTAPAETIEPWLICQLLGAFGSLALSLLMLKNLDLPARRVQILHGLMLTLTLEGLTWGLAPVVLYGPDMLYNLLTLAFVCIACSFSLHTLCLYRPAMLTFMLCLMLPTAIARSFSGEQLEMVMGLGALVVLGLSLFYGLISGRLARNGINASIQSVLLAEQLKSNNADLRTALRAIRQMATRDPLTQCFNRRAMLEYLEREMVSQDRGGQPLGVLLIDVDHFKTVNDTHGHLVGDDVLKALTHRLNGQMRGNDLLARYGGEEFVCLIHAVDEQQLVAAGERIREAIAKAPIINKPDPLNIQVSIGAALRRKGEEGNALFARSDKALYKAKNAGRNRVVLDALASSLPSPPDFVISSTV